MDLLDSPWFLQMVEKQGKAPAERLLAVFRVIAQWIAAPGMRELLAQQHAATPLALHAHTQLRHFLLDTAAAARAASPAILANQLVILLQGALAEELRNPGAQAMQGALQAAEAVISSACRSRVPRLKLFTGALAASLLAGMLTLHAWNWSQAPTPGMLAVAAVPAAQRAASISPETISAVLLLRSRLEQGICPAPELLVMTQEQIVAYQEIVNLQLSDDAHVDWNNMRAFMNWYANTRSSGCYMAPANGHTTVAWVTDQKNAR